MSAVETRWGLGTSAEYFPMENAEMFGKVSLFSSHSVSGYLVSD